jgi:hypothetical protein
VRANLIRALAGEFTVEHLLWRGAAEAKEIERRLRAMSMADVNLSPESKSALLTNRRYIESVWNRAKPTANYDVADRLAVHGVTVDLAAVSGNPDSELSRAVLDEFHINLLPTGNPFTVIFVRTVHGLSLDDLDCMRRYRAELHHLTAEIRALLLLPTAVGDSLYQLQRAASPAQLAPPTPENQPHPSGDSERAPTQ